MGFEKIIPIVKRIDGKWVNIADDAARGFENGKVYDIRFKEGWTGVYNVTDSKFETWTGKTRNPEIILMGDYQVWSQEIDLTFFIDLGLDSFLTPKFAVKANGSFINYKEEVQVAFDNQTTWIVLDAIDKQATADTLLFGHSNIEYWDNYKEDLSEVAEKYNFGNMLNIGIGGTSSSQWKSFKESLITYNASKGIFWIGTNEMPVGATAEQIIANIEETILYMKEYNSNFVVVMVLIPLSPARTPYTETILELNDLIEDLADKYDWIALADLEYAFCDDGLTPNSRWFTDGLHLTKEAYVEKMVPAIDQALETFYNKNN